MSPLFLHGEIVSDPGKFGRAFPSHREAKAASCHRSPWPM